MLSAIYQRLRKINGGVDPELKKDITFIKGKVQDLNVGSTNLYHAISDLQEKCHNMNNGIRAIQNKLDGKMEDEEQEKN